MIVIQFKRFLRIFIMSGIVFCIWPNVSVCQTNWIWRNPLPSGNNISCITYGNDQFVAVGDYGTIMTSRDGVVWTFNV
jgi:trimeric autotransporter adhesin